MNVVDGRVVISPAQIGHQHQVSFLNRVAFQVGHPPSSDRIFLTDSDPDLQTLKFPIVSPVRQIRRRITRIRYVTEKNLYGKKPSLFG